MFGNDAQLCTHFRRLLSGYERVPVFAAHSCSLAQRVQCCIKHSDYNKLEVCEKLEHNTRFKQGVICEDLPYDSALSHSPTVTEMESKPMSPWWYSPLKACHTSCGEICMLPIKAIIDIQIEINEHGYDHMRCVSP